MNEIDREWFEAKFKELDDKINDLSIKSDKALSLARAISAKVLD